MKTNEIKLDSEIQTRECWN